MLSIILSLLMSVSSFTCEEATFIDHTDYCNFLPGNSRWYSFYTETSETVSIITAGNGDGRMYLYQGTCDSLILIGEDDNSGPFLMPQIQFDTEEQTQYYVLITDVDLFEICVFTCGPLPVELISFKVYETSGYATLKWSTGSETNNRMFKIYNSKDAINWEFVGQVPGMGNSSQVNNYTYYDFNKLDNNLRYYKLEQIDYNGDVTTLGILPIFSKKQYKELIKEISINGNSITKDYKGIRIRVYSDKTVEKIIFQ